MVKKIKSKQVLFYEGLQDVIRPYVSFGLKDIDFIYPAAEMYVKEQNHLKIISRRHYNKELLVYIIGELFIDFMLEYLRDSDISMTYKEFEEYVFDKIHMVALFDIILTSPDVLVSKLIRDKKDYMATELDKLNTKVKERLYVSESKV